MGYIVAYMVCLDHSLFVLIISVMHWSKKYTEQTWCCGSYQGWRKHSKAWFGCANSFWV